MKKGKNIIARMSLYKTALNRFKDMGLVKIFSDNIAEAIGVKATQVRKDFSFFEITGNRRGGYVVDELLENVNKILCKDEIVNVVLVGVGNLGEALRHYPESQDGPKSG